MDAGTAVRLTALRYETPPSVCVDGLPLVASTAAAYVSSDVNMMVHQRDRVAERVLPCACMVFDRDSHPFPADAPADLRQLADSPLLCQVKHCIFASDASHNDQCNQHILRLTSYGNLPSGPSTRDRLPARRLRHRRTMIRRPFPLMPRSARDGGRTRWYKSWYDYTAVPPYPSNSRVRRIFRCLPVELQLDGIRSPTYPKKGGAT